VTTVAPALPPTRVVLRSRRRSAWWQLAAALGLATAGGLHVAAAVDHLSAGSLAVGFFLLTALAQAGSAAWLVLGAWAGTRASRPLVAMALLGTVGLLALYVVAHTTGLLDAFAVHDTLTGGHEHDVPGRVTTAVDPVTGVEFAQGMPLGASGPVTGSTAVVTRRPARRRSARPWSPPSCSPWPRWPPCCRRPGGAGRSTGCWSWAGPHGRCGSPASSGEDRPPNRRRGPR